MHHSRGHSAPFGRSACTMAAVYVHHLARRIHITVLLGVIAFFRKIFCKKNENEKGIKIEQKNEGQNNTQVGIQNNNYYGGGKDAR